MRYRCRLSNAGIVVFGANFFLVGMRSTCELYKPKILRVVKPREVAVTLGPLTLDRHVRLQSIQVQSPTVTLGRSPAGITCRNN